MYVKTILPFTEISKPFALFTLNLMLCILMVQVMYDYDNFYHNEPKTLVRFVTQSSYPANVCSNQGSFNIPFPFCLCDEPKKCLRGRRANNFGKNNKVILALFTYLFTILYTYYCFLLRSKCKMPLLNFSQTVKQRQFSKDEFHYLNVTRVGTFTVYDIFDCTFECLSNPLCFSFNLAAFKGEDGKFWCDLQSSDRYRNFRVYNDNMTSHHFFTMVGPRFLYKRFFTTLILLLFSQS